MTRWRCANVQSWPKGVCVGEHWGEGWEYMQTLCTLCYAPWCMVM